jgi:hypothetical protein
MLDRIEAERKCGTERFRNGTTLLDFNLLDFWQWSSSDLVSNALRGRVAEFLVAQALGVSDGIRNEWDSYDLRSPSGLRIEVKSAAYLQTWAHELSLRSASTSAQLWHGMRTPMNSPPKRSGAVKPTCMFLRFWLTVRRSPWSQWTCRSGSSTCWRHR